jgi:tetratricopeptide (TPR) repeat protein
MIKNRMFRLLGISLMICFTSCDSVKPISEKSTNTKASNLVSDSQIRESTMAFFNANKEKLIGNISAAENLYEQTLKLNPLNDAAMYDLGKIYETKGKVPESLELIKKASEISPNNYWYLAQLAQLYIKVNDLEAAIAVYKKLIKSKQDNYQYSFELASLYAYQKKYDDAIKVYNEVEQSTGVLEEISIEKQNIFILQGKNDLAIAEIKKLIQTDSKEIRYQGLLAETYDKIGNKDEAAKVYQKMIDLDPENGMLNLSLSEYYKQNNDLARSFDCMKKVFKSEEIDIDTKVGILLTYFQINPNDSDKSKEAYSLLDMLQIAHPTEAKAPAIYGDFLNRDNKLIEAREKFRQSIQLDKGRFLVWNQVMTLNFQLMDFDNMLVESNQAMDLFPSQPSPYYFKSVALSQKQNNKEAIEVLNAGIELIIDDKVLKAQFYSSLGDAYQKQRDYINSDKSFEKALELDPLNPTVLNNYSYYLSLRGEKLEDAAQMSKLSNDLQSNQASFQDTYAWILYKQSKYDQALIWVENAIKNGGESDVSVIEHYGDILFRLGQIDKAVEQWIKAREKGGATQFIEKKISEKQIYE